MKKRIYHDRTAAFRACLVLCALLTGLAACFCIPAGAASGVYTFIAPKGNPVVDGIISKGEYDASSHFVMDASTGNSWVGAIGDTRVDWYFAWSDEGLYIAGKINDPTPVYGEKDRHWVGMDCLEFSCNPGNLIDTSSEGMFFSFGATADGEVIAWRHNYGDGSVTDMITGRASGHTEGSSEYTIEVFLPWDVFRVNDHGVDMTGFSPKEGDSFGFILCAIDAADASGELKVAYKTGPIDFTVGTFDTLKLAAAPASNPRTGGSVLVYFVTAALAAAAGAVYLYSKKRFG